MLLPIGRGGRNALLSALKGVRLLSRTGVSIASSNADRSTAAAEGRGGRIGALLELGPMQGRGWGAGALELELEKGRGILGLLGLL